MKTGRPLTLVINLDKRYESDDGIGEDQRRGTDIVDPRSGIVVRHYVPVAQSLKTEIGNWSQSLRNPCANVRHDIAHRVHLWHVQVLLRIRFSRYCSLDVC